MQKLRHLVSTVILIATLFIQCALAQTNLTQIRDTIYNSNGTPFNGTIVITWNGSASTLSGTVSPLSTSARIYNGALSVLLVPTTTAGGSSYYQVVYSSSDGTTQWTETWQVPPSSNALSVSGVRTSSTAGSGGSTGSTGTTGGTGTGSTQYATLPIAMSQVTGLTSALSTLTTNISGVQTSVSTLNNNVSTLQSSFGSLSGTVTGLQSSLNTLTTTVNGLSANVSFAFVDGDIPAGTLNGSNTAFTLSQTPSPATSLALYRNGLLERPGIDFTLSGAAVTFTSVSIPKTTDTLEAFYRVAGTSAAPSFADGETPGGSINGSNAAFTLSYAPNPAKSLELFKNGVLLGQGSDYALSGSAITFNNAVIPQSGDSLTASYRH